jgi:hypothetical protein
MKNQETCLRVDRRLYESRRDRMKKLIELNAPEIILRNEAKLFLRSFKRRGFGEWMHDWMMRSWPEWLVWLSSAQYRAIKRDDSL